MPDISNPFRGGPVLLLTIFVVTGCAPMKINLPAAVAAKGTVMKVQGLKGLNFSPKLSFGPYLTTHVKRGWVYSRNIGSKPAYNLWEQQFRMFTDPSAEKKRNRADNQFSFGISDGKIDAQVRCRENLVKEVLVMSTVIGEIGRTENYDYAFEGMILLQTPKDTSAWMLALMASYDENRTKDKAFFRILNGNEHGLLTNRTDSVIIRPLRLKKGVDRQGQEQELPFQLVAGYQFWIGEGVAGIVDLFGQRLWLYDEMEPQTKLLLASAAAAILLCRNATH
jgi:hypothetical protein